MKNREGALTKTFSNLEKLNRLQRMIKARGLTEDDVSPLLKRELKLQTLGFTSNVAEAFAEELKKLGSSPEAAASILAEILLGYRSAEDARVTANAELKKNTRGIAEHQGRA